MNKVSFFKPAWWLPNAHLQTMWPMMVAAPEIPVAFNERVELEDGDFLDLAWVGDGGRPLVLILHGIEGSIESPYIRRMIADIIASGWQACLMHFRGCSGDLNRLPRFYHSGDTEDLAFVIKLISERIGDLPLCAVGYSLGGNVLLKLLGETASEELLTCAVGVSVPYVISRAADRLGSGFSRFYQWRLLKQIKSKIKQKFEKMESPIDLPLLDEVEDFWTLDRKITAPLHGFDSVEEYHDYSSSRRYLGGIRLPTLLIHACDDPFIPADVIPEVEELSSFVELEVSENGGHVGFIAGESFGKPEYWLDDRIIAFFREYV